MAKLRIEYRDEHPADEVSLGAFSQIAAKRRYGIEAMKTEDPEPTLFAAFVEIEGPAVAKDLDAFDAWLVTVERFELVKSPSEVDDDEDPPLAETSSDSSLDSPPTSD